MKVIEVSINVNSLVDKINQLEQLVKEINRFDFKGTFKKEGEITSISKQQLERKNLLDFYCLLKFRTTKRTFPQFHSSYHKNYV